ncbi:MAG: SHOCT domain-containing protein [Acidobacteriota bacterium]|jgi:uncharacterized membrane protein
MMMTGWPMLGLFFALGLLFVLLAGMVWVLTGKSHSNPPPRTDRPEDLLKRLYAQGDISREEFIQKMKDILD